MLAWVQKAVGTQKGLHKYSQFITNMTNIIQKITVAGQTDVQTVFFFTCFFFFFQKRPTLVWIVAAAVASVAVEQHFTISLTALDEYSSQTRDS